MSEIHEIRVQGRLDDRWVDWLEGLELTRENDGSTTLTGPLADQAARLCCRDSSASDCVRCLRRQTQVIWLF